jgi:hypothetical protein
MNCGLYETNSISFKFDQCSNPYFIAKHYPELQKKTPEESGAEPSTPPKGHKKGISGAEPTAKMHSA